MNGIGNLRDYPHVWPPVGFIPIDLNGSSIIPNGSLNVVPISQPSGAAASYRNPTGYPNVIRFIGIEMSSYDPSNAYWSFYQNGAGLRNYIGLTVPIGAPSAPAERFILIPPNQSFELRATNLSGGLVSIRWSIFGWSWVE